MNLKLFYSPPKWLAFIAPEKPELSGYYTRTGRYYTVALKAYEKAYAKSKANALEVGNINEVAGKVVFTKTFEAIDGINYFDWPGSAVIKDGKYILSL